MTRLSEITLTDVLPRVFVGEPARKSHIWDCKTTFHRPDAYIVSAESGTGKSSMCAYIYGARNDYRGTIAFDGRDISTYTIDEWQELRRNHLAYLPQDLDLFPELTAMQNIMLKQRLTDYTPLSRIEEWMEALGITHRADFPVGKMSIGQQQRVAIIRSLCQPFDILMLDEPVSHLDEANNRLAAGIITAEAARQQASIIATSVGNHLLLSQSTRLEL